MDDLPERGTRDLLLEFLSQPSLPTYIAAALQAHRERGYTFEVAWPQTMRSIPRNHPELAEWRKTMKWSRAVWRAFYLGEQEAPPLRHGRDDARQLDTA